MEIIDIPAQFRSHDPGEHSYTEIFRAASLSLGLATWPANDMDNQRPHSEDEVYYVVEGRGQVSLKRKRTVRSMGGNGSSRQSLLSDTWTTFEVELLPGLDDLVEAELQQRLAGRLRSIARSRNGRVAIEYRGDPGRLNNLKTAVAVYRVEDFDVPRPLALLGHQHLSRILTLVSEVLEIDRSATFESFRLSAAGADTAAFSRLIAEVSSTTGLTHVKDQGDLLIVVRRRLREESGWQVLVRLSPRPLSTRPWRRCNYPGALNASIAYSMVTLANPSPRERFLNLACGSGTLMIERLILGDAKHIVGIDLDEHALMCARTNLQASGRGRAAGLVRGDAREIPFLNASFDTIAVDLPYGMLSGSQEANQRLYPEIMREATRLAAPAGMMVAITASRTLFESVLGQFKSQWETERVIPVKVSFKSGYVHPTIYALRRRERS